MKGSDKLSEIKRQRGRPRKPAKDWTKPGNEQSKSITMQADESSFRSNVDLNQEPENVIDDNPVKRSVPNSTKTSSVANATGSNDNNAVSMPKLSEQTLTFDQKQQVQNNITTEMVQRRWMNIFSAYASLGYDNVLSAWRQGFASLNNPFIQNYRIKQINSAGTKVASEDLDRALEDPENSEMIFKRLSMWLYYTNYVYHLLIQLNRDTPTYNYYALPQYIEESDTKKKDFAKDSMRVDKIMKKFDPQLTLKTVATQVNLEGKASYLVRYSYDDKDVDFFLLQKLNSDMVKLTGFGSKQQFIATFNMMVFLQPGYDISQYPEFIQLVWQNMNSSGIIVKNDKGQLELNVGATIPTDHILEWNGLTYMYWVQLPQDLCYTFYTDGAHANSFPDTIGLFDDLNDLNNYKWLQASLLNKGINSVLTAEVPLVKDPKAGQDSTAISPDTVLGYTDLFQQTVSGNILPFFAPFQKFEIHNIENQPEAMDIIFDRTRDLIATSGNSALMSITDKPSIASVKAAQLIQAAKNDYLTRQFERFLNNVVNNYFDLKYEWKIKLWGDIFNVRDDAKNLKELVLSGSKGFIPKLISAYNMSIEDYRCADLYVTALDINILRDEEIDINGNITKTTSTTNVVNKNPVGRPKLDDSDIENDNTGTSNDMGNNVSDIKEFNARNKSKFSPTHSNTHCAKCGKELSDDEEYVCDECLEEIYDERLQDLNV